MSRESGEGRIAGTIADTLSLPMKQVAVLRILVGAREVYARISDRDGYAQGDRVWLTFKRYHVFDEASGARLRTHPDG